MAETLGEPDALFRAASYRVMTAVQSGDFDQADRCLETMRTLSARLQQPTLTWNYTFMAAGEAILRGDHERSEQGAEAALQVGIESGQPDAFIFYTAQLLSARLQQGRLGELATMIEAAIADNPDLSAFQAWLALASLQAGDAGHARELLEAAAADEFASVPYDILWLASITMFAWAAVELRAGVVSERLYELLAPYHEQIQFIGTGGEGPATDLNTRGNMKFAAAWTQLHWGRMVAERSAAGDTEKARELLTQAQATAKTRGYADIERRATQALQHLD